MEGRIYEVWRVTMVNRLKMMTEDLGSVPTWDLILHGQDKEMSRRKGRGAMTSSPLLLYRGNCVTLYRKREVKMKIRPLFSC